MPYLQRLCLLGSFCIVCHSHEIATHTNITKRAVQFLRQQNPVFACASSLEARLQTGTTKEDDYFLPKIAYYPLGRFFFHFFDLPIVQSIQRGVGLRDAGEVADCDSPTWGLWSGGSLDCTATSIPGLVSKTAQNQHRWQDAIANAASGNGWEDLGYVIHLLEDLTSPAHTRNDSHWHLGCDIQYICGDPDQFEITNYGADPLPPSGPLLTFLSPQDAFYQLRNFTQANFYTSDTMFVSPPGPAFKSEDLKYIYGDCLPGTDPACTNNKRKIAHKGAAYYMLATGDRTKATIDDVIAREQFAELGPITVQYVASLIQHYYQAVSPPPPLPGCNPTSTQWLSFIEGNPGVPGDGIFVTAGFSNIFNQASPIALGATQNGFTLTVFPPSGAPFQNTFLYVETLRRQPPCAFVSGNALAKTGTVMVNSTIGFVSNVTQNDIQRWISNLNRIAPTCNFTQADLYVTALLMYGNTNTGFITTLDAAAFGFGQDSTPM